MFGGCSAPLFYMGVGVLFIKVSTFVACRSKTQALHF